MEDSAEGAGDDPNRLANRRRGKGTGNPGKPGKKLRLADLQSQFGVGLKVCRELQDTWHHHAHPCSFL